MKKHVTVWILLMMFSVAFGGGKFNISGRVTSGADSSALAGANIQVLGTSVGTVTDEHGRFTVPPLPEGRYELLISYIGYSSRNLDVRISDDHVSLKIILDQEIISGPMVSVVATMARERVSPVTFSTIAKQELESRYTIQDVPELLSDLPSTTFYSENGNGLGYNYLSIRGFGQRRISVMINGIPQNDPEDHNVYWIDFPDFMPNVQSIQVQRGAGSAFYGPPAIGGSINIQTNYFSPFRSLKASYGMGSFGTNKYALSYNSGLLGDKFVFYSRFSKMESDGYREQAWIDFWSYFLGAAIYAEKSKLRLHFYGGPIKDGLAYSGLPKHYNDDDELRKYNYNYWQYADDGKTIEWDQRRRKDEVEHFNQPHLEILHEYKWRPDLSLNNNMFFVRGAGYFDYNGNWASPAYYRLTPEYGFPDDVSIPEDALVRAYVDNRQIGWLPNLTWTHGEGELVAGAELRYHQSLHWGRLQKGSGLPDEVVGTDARRYYQYKGGKEIASLYIHDSYRFMPAFIMMADLQYVYNRYRLFDEAFIGTEFDVPYHFLNPRFGINVNISPSMNGYVSVSRTTREPRLKNLYDAGEASTTSWEGDAVMPQFKVRDDGSYDFGKPLVKPETLTDVELGIGYRSGNFRGYANLFYMYFQDEIIKKGGLDRFGQPVTGNAERTTHKGLELISDYQFHPRWALSANLMYSRNTLDAYTVYEEGTPVKLDGNVIAGFPDVLANMRLTYFWKNLYISTILKYIGRQYTDNYEDEVNSVDPVSLLNVDLRYDLQGLGLSGISLQARINNVLNKKYLMYGNGDEFFPAATRNGYISLQYEWK